ncbi:hypothetical protein EDB83DRAFT_2323918 [Lactarius deliciosus]|nr:hypothetical protein EDB83DRAFT_2323918 [Lactarius deliciosus]
MTPSQHVPAVPHPSSPYRRHFKPVPAAFTLRHTETATTTTPSQRARPVSMPRRATPSQHGDASTYNATRNPAATPTRHGEQVPPRRQLQTMTMARPLLRWQQGGDDHDMSTKTTTATLRLRLRLSNYDRDHGNTRDKAAKPSPALYITNPLDDSEVPDSDLDNNEERELDKELEQTLDDTPPAPSLQSVDDIDLEMDADLQERVEASNEGNGTDNSDDDAGPKRLSTALSKRNGEARNDAGIPEGAWAVRAVVALAEFVQLLGNAQPLSRSGVALPPGKSSFQIDTNWTSDGTVAPDSPVVASLSRIPPGWMSARFHRLRAMALGDEFLPFLTFVATSSYFTQPRGPSLPQLDNVDITGALDPVNYPFAINAGLLSKHTAQSHRNIECGCQLVVIQGWGARTTRWSRDERRCRPRRRDLGLKMRNSCADASNALTDVGSLRLRTVMIFFYSSPLWPRPVHVLIFCSTNLNQEAPRFHNSTSLGLWTPTWFMGGSNFIGKHGRIETSIVAACTRTETLTISAHGEENWRKRRMSEKKKP